MHSKTFIQSLSKSHLAVSPNLDNSLSFFNSSNSFLDQQDLEPKSLKEIWFQKNYLVENEHMNDKNEVKKEDPDSIEMTGYMKPPPKNDSLLDETKRRLNSVIEEVEEEDLGNINPQMVAGYNNPINKPIEQIKPLKIQIERQRTQTNDSKKRVPSSYENLRMSSNTTSQKVSVRYQMSPSIANNTFIIKPDIKIHGVNFKETQQLSPKNYEWLMKRERSSFRGLPGVIIRNHLKFLKVHSNIQISILPFIRSIVFVIIDALQAILSIFSCVLYIIDCYVQPDDYSTLNFLHAAELVITLIFTFDLMRHFYESKDKVHFFFKIHTVIDILAILPYYISKILPLQNSFNFLHVLQIFRLIRILRLYRLFNDPDIEKSDQINEARFSLDKQLSVLLCTIFATLFICSGLSYELNEILNETYLIKIYNQNTGTEFETTDTEYYTFFYAFYLLFQTFLTLGYGDVTPCTASSRIFMSLVMLLFSLVLVDQCYKLWAIKAKISPYDIDYKRKGHYIVIGYYTENTVQRMLSEIFKEEEQNEKFVLLVRNQPPSPEMLNLIEKFNSQINENVVCYLQCSFMKQDIVAKANVKSAKIIFLMNDPNLRANDNEIFMLLTLFQDANAFNRKIVQINNDRITIWKESPLSNPWNLQFSPKRIKLSLLVGSAFNKGLIPLFNNLMLNSTLFIPQVKTSLECQWLMEYSASSMQSLFLVALSEYFIGKTFRDLVVTIYRAKSKMDSIEGTLVIGIKSFSNIEQNKGHIYLNPQNYRIKSGDHAIVIAKNKDTAEFISFYLEEADLNPSKLLPSDPKVPSGFRQPIETCGIEFSADLLEEYEYKRNMEAECYCQKLKKHILLWKSDVSGLLKGHIIVFAEEECFEMILHEVRERSEKPICFFVENNPSQKVLECAAQNESVFILEGSILNLEHLRNAGVGGAFHVLIFTQVSNESANNLNMDSKAILLSNILEEFFTVAYTMEIADLSEMKLLGFTAKKEFSNLGIHFNPHFMAGDVLPSNMVDSLSIYLMENEIFLEVFKHAFRSKESKENHKIFSIKCPVSYDGRKYEDFLLKCLALKNPVIPLGVLTRRFTRHNTQQFKVLRELQNNGMNSNPNFNTNSPGSISPTKRLNRMYNDDKDPRILRLPLFLINPLPTTVLNRGDTIMIMGEHKGNKLSMQEFPMDASLAEEMPGIKEKNTGVFKEIVGFLKRKMLNSEALEEETKEKFEMIENLQQAIDKRREVLKQMDLEKWNSMEIIEN